MVFDIKIHTDRIFLLAGYMKQIFIQDKIAAVVMQDLPTLSPNKAHWLFGHHNENRTLEIAQMLGILLTKGAMEVCESCAIAKVKQKNTTHNISGHGKGTTYN